MLNGVLNPAVDTGTVKGMDRYHREVRHMENGLAYHFVIGNGSGMGDGDIGIGSRWTKQLDGGHLTSERQNQVSLGICLVGLGPVFIGHRLVDARVEARESPQSKRRRLDGDRGHCQLEGQRAAIARSSGRRVRITDVTRDVHQYAHAAAPGRRDDPDRGPRDRRYRYR